MIILIPKTEKRIAEEDVTSMLEDKKLLGYDIFMVIVDAASTTHWH